MILRERSNTRVLSLVNEATVTYPMSALLRRQFIRIIFLSFLTARSFPDAKFFLFLLFKFYFTNYFQYFLKYQA